jgi:hypothetical protein
MTKSKNARFACCDSIQFFVLHNFAAAHAGRKKPQSQPARRT